MSTINTDTLKEGLMADLSEAEGKAKSTAEGLGVSELSNFSPRAIRAKNLVMGQAELGKLNRAIQKAANELIHESGMVDELEQDKFRGNLKQKMNQVKLLLLKNAGELQLFLRKKKLDQAQQQAIWQALGSAASGIGEFTISQVGGSSNVGSAGGGLSSGPSLGANIPKTGSGDIDFGLGGGLYG